MSLKHNFLDSSERERKLVDEIQQLNRMVELFAYSTSHDLKAPLSTLSGLINLLRKEKDFAHHGTYLEMMSDIVARQEFFLHNITDLLKNARTELVPECILLEPLIMESFQQFGYLSHVAQIEKSVAVRGASAFHSDFIRVKVILHNLISNAIRFQRDDAENPMIRVRVELTPKQAVIRIEDNGIGIEPQYLDKVFDIFFRATEKYTGNGLGLYITKEMVAKLGGELTLRSKTNKGTVVRVVLPNLKKK